MTLNEMIYRRKADQSVDLPGYADIGSVTL